jgi:acyl-CoA dehydrogenase
VSSLDIGRPEVDGAVRAVVTEVAGRTRAFVREVCIPAEARFGGHELDPSLRAELQAAARQAGVFAPHIPRQFGGLGLDIRGWAVVFEEAGYSLLGPQALNCAAPDEGNMRLLELVATEDQKERYLRPLAAGEVRSCFAMTEPHPGAGSDPDALATTARRADGGWVIDGDKRFISGADGAAFAICMARAPEGATMFLIDAGNPGFQVGRRMPTTDTVFAGGHSEVAIRDCSVAPDAVLGEVGQGFRYAQVRLGPARLTHCMRWLGLARRALDIALDRAAEREVFGARLEDLGLAQGLIADSVIDLEASRSLIGWAAQALDAGAPARHETSVAKVFVAEAVFRVIDRSLQLTGGDGVTDDLPLARFLNEVRPFRIYDGPSETHRWAIARRVARLRAAEREGADGRIARGPGAA